MLNDLNEVPRRLIIGVGSVFVLLVIGWTVWVRLPPPRIKLDDEQLVKTVDALFTAITTRDSKRLDQCEKRLKSYHAEHRMSDSVAASLELVTRQAREGQWQPAAKRLYSFIEGQHR